MRQHWRLKHWKGVMASKITSYKTFISSGGNTCRVCGTRMRKGLTYVAPVSGKRVVTEKRGNSICVTCINELAGKVNTDIDAKELEIYERRRFLEHLDKETDNV